MPPLPATFPEMMSYFGFARRYVRHLLEERRLPGTLDMPVHRPDPTGWPDDRLTAAWLGHATVLMNFFGTWLVTDPALADRIGVSVGGITVGPRRLTRPALRVRELPPLDMVLVSHAHMDHLDLLTLARIPRHTRVITHRRVGDLLRRFDQVDELEWGDRLSHDGLVIEGTPARHWGARTLRDRERGYGGFLLEKAGHRVLYAGDTAYTDRFQSYAAAGLDLAILPIGAYDPWIANHANPEEAWRMGRQMGARFVMPVHHSTFRLSREPMDEPLRRLLVAAGPDAWRVVSREIGSAWQAGRVEGSDVPAAG